jgi:hypothetical protein
MKLALVASIIPSRQCPPPSCHRLCFLPPRHEPRDRPPSPSARSSPRLPPGSRLRNSVRSLARPCQNTLPTRLKLLHRHGQPSCARLSAPPYSRLTRDLLRIVLPPAHSTLLDHIPACSTASGRRNSTQTHVVIWWDEGKKGKYRQGQPESALHRCRTILFVTMRLRSGPGEPSIYM